MPSNTKILCIDFGTSSIRAAISQDGRLRSQALELGEALSSSIDRASIPSAIFIDTNCSIISFGEEALKKGLKGEKSQLFEMSPKKWMTAESPDMLNKEIFAGLGLTKKHLLAGLMAQSFSAIMTASGISKKTLLQLETRIAHPIWPLKNETELRLQLNWIAEIGRQLSGTTDSPISIKQFLSNINATELSAISANKFQDVEEPVAAALELFKNSDNSREICVVIDVGAGTTDLGIFLSLTPDESSKRHRRKFIQAASPKSIYMAGDLIDEEVINLIKSRARNLRSDAVQDLQRRRRNIKETLFSQANMVFEAGVEITLSDLEKQKKMILMRDKLAENFSSLMGEASSFIKTFVEASFHQADQINVVFAGGGSNIKFLHLAIGAAFKLNNGRSIPIVIRSAPFIDRSLPAAIERLAVAMGGTTPNDSWPITSLSSPIALTTQWDRLLTSPPKNVELPNSDPGWWREQS